MSGSTSFGKKGKAAYDPTAVARVTPESSADDDLIGIAQAKQEKKNEKIRKKEEKKNEKLKKKEEKEEKKNEKKAQKEGKGKEEAKTGNVAAEEAQTKSFKTK